MSAGHKLGFPLTSSYLLARINHLGSFVAKGWSQLVTPIACCNLQWLWYWCRLVLRTNFFIHILQNGYYNYGCTFCRLSVSRILGHCWLVFVLVTFGSRIIIARVFSGPLDRIIIFSVDACCMSDDMVN